MTNIEKMPFFMSNPDWYKYDEDEGKYVLTPAAPDTARESYENFHSMLRDLMFSLPADFNPPE